MAPHTETLFTSLYSIFYFCKIIGLAPFRFKSRNEYEISRVSIIWSAFLALFLMIYSTTGLCGRPHTNQKLISRVADILDAYFGQMSILMGILLSCFYSQRVLEVVKTIADLDKQAQAHFKVNLNEEYRKTRRYVTFGLFFTTICVVEAIGSVAWATSHHFTWDFLGEFVAYVAPIAVNSFVNFQFCTAVLCLKQRFRWLNKVAKTRLKRSDFKVIEVSEFQSSRERQAIMVFVERLKIQHFGLCNLCREINGIYSIRILMIVVQSFSTIIVLAFFEIKSVLLVTNSAIDYSYLTYCNSHLCLAFVQLLILTVTCSRTSVEAQKLGTLVQCAYSMQEPKSSLYLEVVNFSLQILHQRVEFNACKMFLINENLLLTIIGAVMTYLVIVVQFEAAEVPSQNRSTNLENIKNSSFF